MGFHVPMTGRVRGGRMASDDSYGNNGAFIVSGNITQFTCIASDGDGWEHVSVSLPRRCPTWGEMCHIKSIFWDADDVVMQLHPREREYVNVHQFCLHLWRPTTAVIPTPPQNFV